MMRIADQLQVTCPVFYIDNVAEYLWTNGRNIQVSKLPSLVPPFHEVWLEWSRFGQLGACRIREFPDIFRPEGTKKKCRWFFVVDVFRWDPTTTNEGPFRLGDPVGMWLDERGALAYFGELDDIPFTRRELVTVLRPCLLAISFMHCKNVRRVENTPPFNRARRRRGEREWLKFYTLEIDPMKEVLRREGRIEEVGLKRALHICRGHFATYSGAGLFGKYPGTFWRPSHVRGTAEAGVNVKDYKIKGPGGETIH